MAVGRDVAVFTEEFDVTADTVIVELNRRGVRVFRCNPGDFPGSLSLSARSGSSWTGHLRSATRTLDLLDVGCAWWRRPTRTEIDPTVPEHEWVEREANTGLRGVLATLPWLNSPDAIRSAEHKPLQLVIAARVGLSIPASLITSDPDEARAFAKAHEQVIYKPFTSGLLSDGQVLYASRVDPDKIDDGVRLTAHLFQERIEKAYELRITAVDGQFFTARIDAHSERGRCDWRSDYKNLTYSVAELPNTVTVKLRGLLHAMHLRFAAIDMIVTPEGEHVFIEANPNGQFAWLEDETQLPIAAAIADALEGKSRVH
ncbi:ATP-grasp ribosomal peptide maturase [Actinoplanes sp. NPDC049548]|uniref:ATP-grasp ribosomal peptide maturase n=1 Tax=Actinoplanes sp. NPDC049548 TaxID=3155152 RepID=UPI003415D42A